MKEILLSGGTGYLGGHLSNFLSYDFNLTVLIRKSSNTEKLRNLKNVTLIEIDDFKGGEFDIFINTACLYGRNGEEESQIRMANYDFPKSICEKVGDAFIINFGTSLPSEVSLYAKTKNEFSAYLKSKNKWCNLVLEQFYGPHDGTFFDFLITNFLKRTDELDLTAGEQKRDFIFFKDVIFAVETVIKKEIYGNVPVGTGDPIVLKEAVEYIREKTKATTKLNFGVRPYRDNEQMISTADISILKANGWSNNYTFKKGINWCLQNW